MQCRQVIGSGLSLRYSLLRNSLAELDWLVRAHDAGAIRLDFDCPQAVLWLKDERNISIATLFPLSVTAIGLTLLLNHMVDTLGLQKKKILFLMTTIAALFV